MNRASKIFRQIEWKRFQSKASTVLGNLGRMEQLLALTAEKAKLNRSHFNQIWQDFQTLLALVDAWVRGTYRKAHPKSILMAVAGILYFISPFDAVFDYIPGLGLLDDVTVLAMVLRSLKFELTEFEVWRKQQHPAPSDTQNPPSTQPRS